MPTTVGWCRFAEFGIPLIEDAAEALGSFVGDRSAGSFGSASVLSFNGNKIITTSGGGALLGSKEIVERARYLATQARQPLLHYEHTEIGFNYRMSNILAAIGRAQLAGLDQKIERRREISELYNQELPELEWCAFARNISPESLAHCWPAAQGHRSNIAVPQIGWGEHRSKASLEADAPAARL